MSDEPIPTPEPVPEPAPEPTPTPTPAPPPSDVQTPPGDAKPPEPTPEPVYNIKAPEGFDGFDSAKFVEFAKQLNVKPEDAQAFVDSYGAYEKGRQEAEKSAHEQQMKALNEEYVESIKKDPNLGGANFERTQIRINAAREAFADESVKELFDTIGNHPGLVRMMEKIGSKLEQATFTNTGKPTPSKEALGAKAMYSNSPDLK